MIRKGNCYLVGGGPGDPGLVTLRARQLLESADVIVYDSLVNEQILECSAAGAEKIYAGKRANKHVMKQPEINDLLVARCLDGKSVVRLKGGDPFIFGRGGEEAEALTQAGIPFEVVPGVTSGISVPAYAGIPLTHREHSTSVTFVTGHECPKESGETDWAALATLGGTLVIYMGVRNLPNIVSNLMNHGMDKNTPAAFIQWGCDPRQKSISATLSDIVPKVTSAGLAAPAIIVIGAVSALHDQIPWFSKKPLLGKKVIVTRIRKQNSRLRELLEEQGAWVVEMPLIRKIDIDFDLPLLSAYQWLVFTSPNAVDVFMRKLCRHQDLRALGSCKIAAVGPATSDELLHWNLKADFIPSSYNAEILALEWPPHASGQSVLFPCGRKAADTLEKELSKKGCTVSRLEIYDTIPDPDAAGIWKKHLDSGWILFCSSSAVESFRCIHSGPLPAGLKAGSLGPQTSRALQASGIEPAFEAPESTLEHLVESLAQSI